MPNIGGVQVEYTDGGGRQHTFRKYVASIGDAASFLAGDGTTIALTGATPNGSSNNAGNIILAFLKCLELVAPTGSIIRSLNADFRVDGPPGQVDATASFNWSGFTPAGGSNSYGPYPTGFCAIKSRVPASHRPGWLRFYTTGATVWGLTTVFDPVDVDPALVDWLQDLTTLADNLTEYAIWSGYEVVGGSWLSAGLYNPATMRLGCANG